ncbi:hypothetical protein HNP84_003141 [Thermocatellispora tengchongensis]|uniref:PepSY domain-containing protein n=1 Tax=Thermocatellispora tengchongensis TaxID=1073253 RepID=A0A840PBN6_9ACTN|nr:PepSY domain-containing protein [Thermocatellispora tengchongensis]MBB5133415.1 hypothetical protein [Thermocatellispora tengchongensis]
MRKPAIVLSGLALAALAAGGGVAFADQNPAATPGTTATPAPSTGGPSTDSRETVREPAVSAEEAQRTALAKVPGGWIVSTELDDDDDRDTPVWEIEIAEASGARHDVTVNATGGEIMTGGSGTQDDADDTPDADDNADDNDTADDNETTDADDTADDD